MKIALSIATLLAGMSLSASADGIDLSNYETWADAYAEGDDVWYYTSSDGTYDNWEISSGTYSVTTSSNNYGIYLYSSSSSSLTLSENATLNINVTPTDYSSGRGIFLSYDSTSFTNNGTLDIDVTAEEESYGIYLYTGSFDNNGKIDIDVNATGDYSYGEGIYLYKSTFANNSGGTINIDVNATYGYGIYLYDSTSFDNNGTLDIDVTGVSDYGVGIFLYDSTSFTNNSGGTINIDVNDTELGDGIYLYGSSSFTNNGTLDIDVTAENGYGDGICLESSSTFTNNSGGTINIDVNATDDYGIVLYSSAFYNAGSLSTDSVYTGYSGYKGSFYLLDGSTLGASTENGSVTISGYGTVYLGSSDTGGSSTINVTSGLSISSSVELKDNVTLKVGGDLSFSGGVRSPDGYSLTIDNSDNDSAITISSSSFSVSSLTITGSNGTITLDGVNISVTDSASLSNCVVQGTSSITGNGSESSTLSCGSDVILVLDFEEGKYQYVGTTLTITCDLLSAVTVEGVFTLDLSEYMETIIAGGYETVTVNFGDTVSLAEDVVIYAISGYGTATATGITSGTASFTASTLVPEPATATLSLLGLGALLVRRRRH